MAYDPNMYGPQQPADKTAITDREKMGEIKQDNNPTANLYWREIERYDRATSDWMKEGDEIEKVFLDENRVAGTSTRKFAMLWANVETLRPAVYTKTPSVQCSRRYKDRDPVGRTAAELIERATNTTFELYGVDEVFRMARDDRLLPGRGQAWVRYEATLERYEDPRGVVDGKTGEIVMHERLKSEKACVDYVHWKDFGHSVSRTWKEVWLVWRIVYKTREEAAERFGEDKAASLTYNAVQQAFGSGSAKDDPDNRCKIYEIWDKLRNQVVWMAAGQKGFLDEGPPPIDFREFFPCPEPCYSTKTSKQLIPVPDYRYYKDQVKEINDLTEKIGNMTQWLIVKGFIPGAPSGVADPIKEALEDKGNREMFQEVESFAEFTERGGAAKLIDWLPIDKVIQAIQAAISARNQLIQDVFQITGLSDILRGQTDSRETLGAQELKAQTGSRRLRNTKDEIARFCRDVGRLVSEVIAEKFEPQSIAEITGYKYVPTPAPMPMMSMMPRPMGGNVTPFPGAMPGQSPMMGHNVGPQMQQEDTDQALTFGDDVIELLRNDRMRSFRVDIETDSTVQADENQEKQSRMEFMGAAGQFLERAAKAAIDAPDMVPILGELMMFTTRGFRAGRSMEEALERSFAKMETAIKQKQAQPPQPDPRLMIEGKKLEQQAQANAADQQLEARGQDIDAALQKRKQDLDASLQIRSKQIDANAQARDHAARLLSGESPT